MADSVNRQMATGAGWMILVKLLGQSISLVSTFILARLLVPEDFGLVALAAVFMAFLELMRAFNFDVALIQNQQATREHYDTAWTFNVIAAGVIGLVAAASAPYVAVFFGDSRIETILYVVAIGVAISGMENVGVVAFRKELTFKKEFFYMLAKKLISFFSTICLALYLRSYWALVFGMLMSQIGAVTISYIVHSYRPRLELKKWRDLLGFSSWLMLNNVLFFINNKIPELVIGKSIGAGPLGVYSVSFQLSNLPTTELISPLNRALMPGFSKINHDLNQVREVYCNAVAMVSIIAVPAAAGISVLAPMIVPLLLGEKWLAAVPVVQWLALSGVLTVLVSCSGSLFLALGKPRIITMLGVCRALILVPLVVIGSRVGMDGVIYGLVITSVLTFPIAVWATKKSLSIGWLLFFKQVIKPIIASAVMYAGLFYLTTGFDEINTFWLAIKTSVFISLGAAIYFLIMTFLWFIAGDKSSAEYKIFRTVANKIISI